jgi:tetratricopeptide (TPR) repeat protein
MNSKSRSDNNNATSAEFSALFPEGIRADEFNEGKFFAATRALEGTCAERLRKLAIWHSKEYPASSIGDWKTLEILYRHAATLAPEDPRIPHSRGISALQLAQVLDARDDSRQMYCAARRSFEEALRIDPSSADTMYLLGLSCYFENESDTSEAKRWFLRALDAEPGMARARLYLAHCLQDEGAWQEALDEYERVDEVQLSSEIQAWHVNRLWEQMGYCCMKLERIEESIRLFDLVLEKYENADPDNLPEELIGYPSELIDAATSELADKLFDRVEKFVKRYGWETFYAEKIARGRMAKFG